MPLARLRGDLDVMPSPVPERPGLFIRDPLRYSDAQLIVPPALAQLLGYFDGETPELDVRHALAQATGDIRAGEVLDHLTSALDQAGFLENETFSRIKDTRRNEFVETAVRPAAHTGPSGYPDDQEALRMTFDGYLRSSRTKPDESTIGVAAPHVSPFGGFECYADAYSAIPRSAANKTFVILGTSHYGEPDRFGLTHKPFETPYGATLPALDLIDELERDGREAVAMEDYCHAVEHSIEFQVAFLQHLFGPQVRVLPILCGSFGRSIHNGFVPESNDGVKRFLGALGELGARHQSNLFWVLGIDMAHIGRRYGGAIPVQAHQGPMAEVEIRDKARISAIEQNDADGFWEQVKENRDDLNWCGSSPVYSFLRAEPRVAGESLRYEQWNIDTHSVVSFAAMRFQRK